MAQYNNIAVVRVKATLYGTECSYKFPYVNNESGVGNQVDDFVAQFNSAVIPVWAAALGSAHVLTHIKVNLYRNTNGTVLETESEQSISEPGTNTGSAALPPEWTVTLKKVPDNTTRLPSALPAFEAGRMAISGVPEAGVNGRTIDTGFRVLLEDFIDAFQQLTVVDDATNRTWDYVMAKTHPEAPPNHQVLAPVSLLSVHKVGTQNTRKR
jgi:hypothetical protein